MALDSSVTTVPALWAASSACASGPMRNICGVCASHLPVRSSVPATRPFNDCLSVSGRRCASKPPTSSCWQSSISWLICAGVTRQRAASCTSTQSLACAPDRRRASSPARTLPARLAPPHAATSNGLSAIASKNPSPGATTTSVRASRPTRRKAARVCSTIACPATAWYCLAAPKAETPARLPCPAQGIRAKKRLV
ncbi:MAG: mfd [Polaromonas sp.]|nr:mfd [Polaromonas sp.]